MKKLYFPVIVFCITAFFIPCAYSAESKKDKPEKPAETASKEKVLPPAKPIQIAIGANVCIGDVMTSFPSPGPRPTGLAWDGKALWLAEKKTRKLYRLDPETGKVLKSFEVPLIEPTGLAWDGEYLWVIDAFSNLISVINPKSGKVETGIRPFIRLVTPSGLAWMGNKVWISDSKGDVIVGCHQSGMPYKRIGGPTAELGGLAVMGNYFWCSDRRRDRISLITRDGEVLCEIPSPGPHPTGLAFDGDHLWVADYETDKIYKLCINGGNPIRLGKEQKVEVEYYAHVVNRGAAAVKSVDVFYPIPVDMPGQRILGEVTFDPQPAEILTDQWGQRVARLSLTDIEKESVKAATMTIRAAIRSVRIVILPESVGNRSEIPEDVRKLYLSDDKMYQIEHPVLKKAVKECFGNETNLFLGTRTLVKYMSEKITYNLDGRWNNASQVLRQGHGSCSEFTYVFIAMARSWGLPARYVGGTLMRGDKASIDSTYHRWPEVYIPPYGWVAVEPSVRIRYGAQLADFIGYVDDRAVITTIGGGNSNYVKWTYIARLDNVKPEEARVGVQTSAEWQPLKEDEKPEK
jgi:transglutaminase-like putative cysteine protease